MWQDLIRIPLPFSLPVVGHELVIHGFGLMLVIGFLIAMEVGRRLARRSGIDPELFSNAAILALVTGILGARLSHVIENLGDYTRADRSFAANFADAVNITSGGLTYYGGFLLAFPTVVLYGLWKKIPIRTGMDIVAPCLMIGLGFGRVGCFLNGCCFGATCALPWAVHFPYGSPPHIEHVRGGLVKVPGELLIDDGGADRMLTPEEVRTGKAVIRNPLDETRVVGIPLPPEVKSVARQQHSAAVHPAQLYSAVTALSLAVLLLVHFTTSHAPGHTFALMMMLEGAARYTLEMLRVEPPVLGPMSISMVLSVGLIAGGAVLWVVFAKKDDRAATEALPAAAQPS